MSLNPSYRSDLEQLALNGLTRNVSVRINIAADCHCVIAELCEHVM